MLDITRINLFLQNRLKQHCLQYVEAVEAARWLDQEGLLSDSISRPGKPLRDLLRAGQIMGQRQEENRRWFIDQVDGTGNAANTNDNIQTGQKELLIHPESSGVLPDILDEGLRVVFVGTAVGNTSARRGHYYSNPQNTFYEELYKAGLTPKRLLPEEDRILLSYGIGLTDLVKDFHTSNDSTINNGTLSSGIDSFCKKLKRFKPAWICFNGKKAYKAFTSDAVEFGPANLTIEGCNVFIVPSTSGRVPMAKKFNGKTRSEWFRDLAHSLPAV